MKIEIIKSKSIAISKICNNTGQIAGVPKNPRFIKDQKYEKLKKSIEDNPEMLGARELLVYPLNDTFVIIGGNMRYRAAVDLGYTELPCKILSAETTAEQLRAFTIKDNVAFGENDWDLLANEWEAEELEEWGMDVPNWSLGIDENLMSEEDINLDDDFDPIGLSAGQQRVVFIFDGNEEAESYLNSLNVKFIKRNMAWQVDMSTKKFQL